jgi:hypothetical protein
MTEHRCSPLTKKRQKNSGEQKQGYPHSLLRRERAKKLAENNKRDKPAKCCQNRKNNDHIKPWLIPVNIIRNTQTLR